MKDETSTPGEALATFSYHPRWWTATWVSLFFTVCGVVLTRKAMVTNDWFIWLLAISSWGLVALVVIFVILSWFKPQRITVTTTGLTVPVGRWRRSVRFVSLDEITDIFVESVSGATFLRLETTDGTWRINRLLLPEDDDFDAILHFVTHGEWAPELARPENAQDEGGSGLHAARATTQTRGRRNGPWQLLALKLTALVAFCGGPLYVHDRLEATLGDPVGFLVAFTPVGLMIIAALTAIEERHTTLTRTLVIAGGIGASIVVAESAYAVAQIAGGEPHGSAGLILFGSLVSVVAAVLFVRVARRHMNGPARGA